MFGRKDCPKDSRSTVDTVRAGNTLPDKRNPTIDCIEVGLEPGIETRVEGRFYISSPSKVQQKKDENKILIVVVGGRSNEEKQKESQVNSPYVRFVDVGKDSRTFDPRTEVQLSQWFYSSN